MFEHQCGCAGFMVGILCKIEDLEAPDKVSELLVGSYVVNDAAAVVVDGGEFPKNIAKCIPIK